MVHDERSRAFAMPTRAVDRSTWRDKAVRLYDPRSNPAQSVGNCTMCAKAMQFNAVGNRRAGIVLGMGWALDGYRAVTRIDPFPGQWEPDDTGSSGLASCKAAQQSGDGGEYRWLFGGADEVVQNIMEGYAISAGTWWYGDMFEANGTFAGLPIFAPTGGQVGGHQYVLRGYDKDSDLVLGRCWWGGIRDFWIFRENLDMLLRDGGDAHWQARA